MHPKQAYFSSSAAPAPHYLEPVNYQFSVHAALFLGTHDNASWHRLFWYSLAFQNHIWGEFGPVSETRQLVFF